MSIWPEENLRDRVTAGGGRVSMSADELLRDFGIRQPTQAARRNVEMWLAQAGLGVDPSLGANGLPSSVTLYERKPLAELPPPAAPERVEEPAAVDAAPAEPVAAVPAAADAAPGEPKPPRPAPAARRPAPAARRSAPARTRGEAIRRRVSTFLFVLGALMVAEFAITVIWQEPVSAYLQHRAQEKLKGQLDQLDAKPLDIGDTGRLELSKIRSNKRRLDRRLDLLGARLARDVHEGGAVGRLEVSRIGLSAVVVQGTSAPSLRKAPGHYTGTVMPGQNGSVGIAGHRTSYGAPFRHVDQLKTGDKLVLTMPYGRFTYRVERKRIVSPSQTDLFQRVGYQRLVLSACHPLYSAAQRILVFARLESRRPLGAGAIDDRAKNKMALHVDPRKRYQRQLHRLGKRDLKLGDKGKGVRELQRLLGLPQTGRFDALTAAAVKQFQQQHKLPVVGQAGPATKRLLARRAHPPSRPPTPPDVAPQPPNAQQRRAAGLPPLPPAGGRAPARPRP
ncbi:MAG: sortase [Thermoleophilaceae bacterium]|nr:sortase [Thermoleophilaceae bacterium]